MGCGSSTQTQPPKEHEHPTKGKAERPEDASDHDTYSFHGYDGSQDYGLRGTGSATLSVIQEVETPLMTPIDETPRDMQQRAARDKVSRLPRYVVDKLLQLHHVSLLSGDISTIWGACLLIRMGPYPPSAFRDFHKSVELTPEGEIKAVNQEAKEAILTETRQFYSVLFDCLTKNGGDIVGTVGDTIVVLFMSHESLATQICRAATCGHLCSRELAIHNADTVSLLPKFAIGAGNMTSMFFFSEHIRPGLMIAGNCITSIHDVLDEATWGEVVITHDAAQTAGPSIHGQVMRHGKRVLSIVGDENDSDPVGQLSRNRSLKSYPSQMISDHGESISRLVPKALPAPNNVYSNAYVHDTSLMSVMLVRVDYKWDDNEIHWKLDAIQRILRTVQEAVAQRLAGAFCDFAYTEAGLVIMAAFGARLHSGGSVTVEANACLKAALMTRAHLARLEMMCTIAVSSGLVYAGHVGGTDRNTELLVGAPVAVANSMLRSCEDDAMHGHVYCDKATSDLCQGKMQTESAGRFIDPISEEETPFFRTGNA